VQLREVIVIKRDGKRVAFDREKVVRSVKIALRKRPVEPEQLDQLVSGIIRKLESEGENEVESAQIGALVMAALREIDPVGYVRYASVYKDFSNPLDFAQFIESAKFDDDIDDEPV